MSDVSRFAGRSLLSPTLGDRHDVARQARRDTRKAMFDRVQDLHAVGKPVRDITEETGIGRRTAAKWIQSGCLQHRRPMPPKPSSPSYFQESCPVNGKPDTGAADICFRTFGAAATRRVTLIWSGCCRSGAEPAAVRPTSRNRLLKKPTRAINPATGWQISPVVAASLCVKPTRMLTPPQAVKVAALKQASPIFIVMRRLAMRFRGILRGNDPE